MYASDILSGVALATILIQIVSAQNQYIHPTMCAVFHQKPMRQNHGAYAVPLVRDFQTGCQKDCYLWQNGTDYRGTVAHTKSGLDCQAWASDKPHEKYKITNSDFEKYGLQKNYCRNPHESRYGPWYKCCSTIIEKSKTLCLSKIMH